MWEGLKVNSPSEKSQCLAARRQAEPNGLRWQASLIALGPACWLFWGMCVIRVYRACVLLCVYACTCLRSLVDQSSSICLQCRRTGFDPWVGKIPWRTERLPTPVFLPGELHGQRSLVGYSPWGHKESDTTDRLTTLNTTCLHACVCVSGARVCHRRVP